MRARALATISRSLAVYVAIVAGAAAIRAVVGVLVLGEWFIGAGLAAWLAAWLALPIPTNTLVTRDVVIRRSRLRRQMRNHSYGFQDVFLGGLCGVCPYSPECVE